MVASVVCFALIIALMSVQEAGGCVQSSKCVSLFFQNNTRFKACETKKCFLFRYEKPFVFLDEKMKLEEHQAPFKCRDRKKVWPNLKGAFFDIMDNIPEVEDALCVWAGSKDSCVFDDMVRFLEKTSIEGKHKFVVGGLMFLLGYRVSRYTIPSVPMLENQLNILGPSGDSAGFKESFRIVSRPFTTEAWIFIISIMGAFLLVRIVIALNFMHRLDRYSFWSNLFGEYDTVAARRRIYNHLYCESCSAGNSSFDLRCDRCRERRETEDERIENLRALNTNWYRATHLSVIIIVLFYEIAVVNFVFARKSFMNDFEPSKFVLRRDTTQEYAFLHMLRRKGLHQDEEKVTWNRKKDLDEVFQTMMNSKPPKFSLSYEVSLFFSFEN